ncbi:MAG: glycosyltransferase [Hyphomicrobiaceae bacterium]|nr:glycosyltransferase [Hyphomicrobiaceae bacterium]
MSRLWIAEGRLDEIAWGEASAAELGLRFVAEPDVDPAPKHERCPPPRAFQLARLTTLGFGPHGERAAAAPAGGDFEAMQALLRIDPLQASRIVITTKRALRAAMRRRHAARLTALATDGLYQSNPAASAKVLDFRVGSLVATALFLFATASLIALLAGWVSPTGFAIQSLFLLLALIRVLAAISPDFVTGFGRTLPERPPDAELPTYAVLVPLYREPEIVAQLLAGLAALRYPADRLEILLLIEADDDATRAELARHAIPARIEVVLIPPSQPRTKPKALNFALATTGAELITIFDAEDKPDARQLLKAAAVFADGDHRLGCLQASLVIDHAADARSWVSDQFQAEYLAHFDGLLPWIGRLGIPFPLGGTSTHLKRAAIDGVGGWDPHNVTEDADLGMRLATMGWTMDWLPSWTLEEAPLRFKPWLRQRTRWLKGWMVSWLVAMRHPRRFWRTTGPRGAIGLHVLIGGALMTALAFPLSLFTMIGALTGLLPLLAQRSFIGDLWLAVCIWTFLGGWLGPMALSVTAGRRRRRPVRLWTLLTMPVYWCWMSIAMVAALRELIIDPHRWNKTSHGIASRPAPRPSPPTSAPKTR